MMEPRDSLLEMYHAVGRPGLGGFVAGLVRSVLQLIAACDGVVLMLLVDRPGPMLSLMSS